MKLYYFDPCDYGQEAFVMAESPEKAKEYLLKYKKPPEIIKNGDYEYDRNSFMNNEIDDMNNEIDDMVNFRQKYKLREFDVGEVVFSEIC